MIVLSQKYIFHITSVFHLHFAILVKTSWSFAVDLSVVYLSLVRYLLYVWEWVWCFDCIMPRQYQLLDIDCGTTCRIWAIAWHVLPNLASDLLCDISLYGSLVFPYIPVSWIVLSILNTHQPHHWLEAFASGFMFSCVPLSLDPTTVDFFSPFSLHKEAFLDHPTSTGPLISPETFHPIWYIHSIYYYLNLLELFFMYLIIYFPFLEYKL